MREAPHQPDREQRARERGERDEGRARAERDGEDRPERRAGLRPGDERIRERVAKEPLEQDTRGGKRATDENGAEDARQPELADDRAVGVVAAEERREHAARIDGDRADEHGRGRAHQERGQQHGHDDGRAHYLKSSGWTMRAYASAASPTRGPGRLMRFGAITPMRSFFTALMADQPARALTCAG